MKKVLIVCVVAVMCLVLTASLFAGGKKEEPAPAEMKAPAAAAEEKWLEKESPMIHKLVEAGQLPPLSERLPENPLVVKPFKELGTYGGTLRRGTGAFYFPGDWLVIHMTQESFFKFTWPLPGEGGINPNLAERGEFNQDGTQLTVYLRKGVKWSDGQPFTADDVLFLINDVVGDSNVAYQWYHVANLFIEGKLPKVEKLNDYTIRFTYPHPYFFAEQAYACLSEIALPKHTLAQYHPKYNSGATYDDFNQKILWHEGRGKVTLMAWMLESFDPDDKLVMVRNPYYWKVDPEGNQLPYFDKVEAYVAGDRQGVAMGVVTGKYDMDNMWVGIQHLSLFLEQRERGDYSIGHSVLPGMGIWFNFDTDNATARKIMRNVDFRRAFSLAINRPEIGKLWFYDKLIPMGASFSPNSLYFEESVGKLYSEYDPARAKKILDDAKIIDRNGDGVRELPSGEKCELVWDIYQHDLYVPITEYIVENLAAVGIRLIPNIKDQSIIIPRILEAKTFDLGVYDLANVDEPLAGLDFWTPVREGLPFWHKNASKAPLSREYARFVELLNKAKSLPFEERVAAMKEANKILAENVFVIHVGYYERPNVVSNRLGNAPLVVARIDEFGSCGPEWMWEQMFEKYPPK